MSELEESKRRLDNALVFAKRKTEEAKKAWGDWERANHEHQKRMREAGHRTLQETFGKEGP